MGAVLLSPIYLLLCLYLITRALLWASSVSALTGSLWFCIPVLTLYALIALTPLFSAFGRGRLKYVSKIVCNYWMGTMMYLLIFLLAADLGHILYCLAAGRPLLSPVSTTACQICGGVILTATAALTVYGIVHASHITKTAYEVTIRKDCALPSLNIALVADLHLGRSVGLRRVRQTAALIEAIHPDLIIFAGDIFDNEFDAVQQPQQSAAVFAGLKSTFGSFACWGNHDIEEVILAGFTFDSGDSSVSSDPRMVQFLHDAGIRLLADESLLIGGAFYLCGRPDASCLKKSGVIRQTPDELIAPLSPGLPILVIDHQPSQLRELAAAGADLVLSGHTHDGQMFPISLITRLGWLNSCGKLCLGKMTSIVTSGAGVWGPAMRIGTDNEVVQIRVRFEKDSRSASGK